MRVCCCAVQSTKRERRCWEWPRCRRRHISDGNLSRLISNRLFPHCYHGGVRSHRPDWMGVWQYRAARIWFLGYWFFCVMRSGWVSRECKYEEDWIFFFHFLCCRRINRVSWWMQICCFAITDVNPPPPFSWSCFTAVYPKSRDIVRDQLWKPDENRGFIYFIIFISLLRLMTADPMHTMKNIWNNISAEGRRNKPQQPKAVLSFNWLHQIMESRALMNGWRAVKHTSAG